MNRVYRDPKIRAYWARSDVGPSHSGSHTHGVGEVLLFLDGKASFWVEGSEYHLSPGDLLIMRPMEAHFIRTDPGLPYERIVLNFDMELLRELDPEAKLLRPFFQRDFGKGNYYRADAFPDRRYQQYLKDMSDPEGSRATALGNLILFLQILDKVSGSLPKGSGESTLEQKILMYIHWNLNRRIDIEDLCSKFYISRTQLCNSFRQTTGMPVGRYITMKRMAMAQQMIREGVNPTEVALRLGYKEYSAFFRGYKAQFGYGPKEEQKQLCEIADPTLLSADA